MIQRENHYVFTSKIGLVLKLKYKTKKIIFAYLNHSFETNDYLIKQYKRYFKLKLNPVKSIHKVWE